MTENHQALRNPPAPDLCWDDYEDVTVHAKRCGIKYPVLLDVRAKSLLERDLDVVAFEETHKQPPVAIYILLALRFLLDRFPSMTRFRYSVGPGRVVGCEKVPVVITFHEDQERGYFLAVTLDINDIKLDQ